MLILVINCGSSSLKYQLFDINSTYNMLAKGLVERIGGSESVIEHKPTGKDAVSFTAKIPDHVAAMKAIEPLFTHPDYGVIKDINEIHGIGHRVLHGGEKFTASTLINNTVLDAIRENIKFGPLHNPANIAGIETCQKLMPGVPNVAVFDTAVHQTMPPKAFLYALPMDLYEKQHIRKYGFHGTSHRFVSKESARVLKKPFDKLRIITCHLGNGSSLAAFENGKCVDTSMGLTPLEGLIMGTRSGDLDPAVVLYLQEVLGLSIKQTNDLLNKQSGLKGLCGRGDMRDVVKLANENDKNARIAIEAFVYRIQKYIGAYLATLNGADAIVFTAGIGENSPFLREQILEKFTYVGVKIDTDKNRANEQIFSTKDSKIAAMMVRTNEELVIAQDTFDIITRR